MKLLEEKNIPYTDYRLWNWTLVIITHEKKSIYAHA